MAENKNNITNDELLKLLDDEMDNVAGGVLGFGEDYEDGHEKSCMLTYHHANECKESPDGYHYWEFKSESSLTEVCTRCGKLNQPEGIN